jgi:hypothetical protein
MNGPLPVGPPEAPIVANGLEQTLDDLIAAFRFGIARINGCRDQMGFMFKHTQTHEKTG